MRLPPGEIQQGSLRYLLEETCGLLCATCIFSAS